MRYRDSIKDTLTSNGVILSEEDFADILPRVNDCDDVIVAYIVYEDRQGEEGHLYVGVESEDDIRLYEAELLHRFFWLVDPNLIAEYRV